MRQIVLDTETTGLAPEQGHRIIEIGCVELVNRRLTGNHYHQYLKPDREIDAGAIEVHGITNEFLQDKPLFEDIVDDFIDYIKGAELIIHNAAFDVGFINHELNLLQADWQAVKDICEITDTLIMARKMHPGQKNSLDALCKRYEIDNSRRELHGALLDSEILADVFLAMTGGQVTLSFDSANGSQTEKAVERTIVRNENLNLKVLMANDDEVAAHEKVLETVRQANSGQCVWDN